MRLGGTDHDDEKDDSRRVDASLLHALDSENDDDNNDNFAASRSSADSGSGSPAQQDDPEPSHPVGSNAFFKHELRAVWGIAAPIALTYLLNIGISALCTAFAGRLGAGEKAKR